MALTSCSTLLGGPKEETVPNSVVKKLTSYEKIAVLGYNTSRGLDDRLLDSTIKEPFSIAQPMDTMSNMGTNVGMASNDLKFPM